MDDNRDKQLAELKRLIFIAMGLLLAFSMVISLCFGIQTHRLMQKMESLQEGLGRKETDADTPPKETGGKEDSGPEQEQMRDTSETDSLRRWEKEAAAQPAEMQSSESSIRRVYLTFDDGPSIYTDQILDILKSYNVKATFFVVGKGKDSFAKEFRRMADEGHTIGMHSYSHVYHDIYKSKEAFVKDVNEIQDYVYKMTDVHPSFYRFPGGSSNHTGSVTMSELEAYLKEIDITYFDWNISSGDATGQKPGKDQILQNSLTGIDKRSDSVILFHDAADKQSTVEALPEIIEAILAMEDTVILPITEDTVPVQHEK